MYPTRFWIVYPAMGALGALIVVKLASERVPTNLVLWVAVVISGCAWLATGVRLAFSTRMEPGEKARPNSPNQMAVGLIVAGTGPALVGRLVDHRALLWICGVGLVCWSAGFLGAALILRVKREVQR